MAKFTKEQLLRAEQELFGSSERSPDFTEQQVRLAEIDFDNTPQDHQTAVTKGAKTQSPDYASDSGSFFPGLKGESVVAEDNFVNPDNGLSEKNVTNLLNRVNRLELQNEVVRRKFDQVFSAISGMATEVAGIKGGNPTTGGGNFGL